MSNRAIFIALLLLGCGQPAPPRDDFVVVLPRSWDDCRIGCFPPPGTSVFVIDRLPATRKDFDACVKAGVCGEIGTELSDPADVERERAEKYCKWRGLRFPTDGERIQAALAVPRRIHHYGKSVNNEWTQGGCVWVERTGETSSERASDLCAANTFVRCARTLPYDSMKTPGPTQPSELMDEVTDE